MSKPKEFFITRVHSYVNGVHKLTSDLIVENPSSEDLMNNGTHVIEYSAYETLEKISTKLRNAAEKLGKANAMGSREDVINSMLELSNVIEEYDKFKNYEEVDWAQISDNTYSEVFSEENSENE